MRSTTRPAFTKQRAAVTGFAAFVVFAIAISPQAGLMIGLGVFVAHWFAALK
ncbi:hypothetical protein [Actinoplanes sp. NPDC023714]|uniref:hypothetical protein n=1 Tax=Actinoplanes sp. NPDC023714 TaxID=3154322 RepID=UPI003402CA90